MLTQQIADWLHNPERYQSGIDLLKRTGFSPFTLGILAKGENAYSRKRVEDELRKWLETPKNSPAAAPDLTTDRTRYAEQNSVPVTVAVDYGVSTNVIVTKPIPDQEPPRVVELRQKSRDLQNERDHLKAQLFTYFELEEAGTDADETKLAARRDKAFRIKAITREMDEIMSQLDFFGEQGYLPPLAEDPSVLIDDKTQLMNVRTYVSLYKRNVREAKTQEKRQAAQSMLDKYLAEKSRLEKKLQNDAV